MKIEYQHRAVAAFVAFVVFVLAAQIVAEVFGGWDVLVHGRFTPWYAVFSLSFALAPPSYMICRRALAARKGLKYRIGTGLLTGH